MSMPTMHRHRTRKSLWFEAFESRQLLSAVEPTAVEQYMVELINRARANPTAEAARYSIDLNEGLSPGTLSSAVRQPLAINLHLTDAARLHAQWMADNNLIKSLPHFENVEGTASGGTPRPGYHSPGDRATTAGYSGGIAGAENQAYTSGGGASPTAASMDALHKLLFKDFTSSFEVVGRGHRKNILQGEFVEVGVGNVNKGGLAVSVQDFARNANHHFLTGVVYRDSNSNSFYTPGEGISTVTITATRVSDSEVFETTTWGSGGYTLELPNGTYTVVASGGTLDAPQQFENITIASLNVKQDVVLGGVAPAAPADLIVNLEVTKTPGIVVPGEFITVVVTAQNTGGTAITAPFDIQLTNSVDSSTNSFTFTKGLGAGKSGKATVKIPVSSSWDSSNISFFAEVDPADAIDESNESNNTASLSGPSITHRAGTFSTRSKVKLTVPDRTGDGSVPTLVTLTGAGYAEVATTADGLEIDLQNTDAKSVLTIAAASGSPLIHRITATTPMKSILAKNSALAGVINVQALGKIVFDDSVAESRIVIHTADPALKPAAAVEIQFDDASDLSVSSGIPIKLFVSTQLLDSGTLTQIDAPSIAAIKINGDKKRSINGDFQADVLTTDAAAKLALGSVTVAGNMSGVRIRSAGHIGTVTVGALIDSQIYAGYLTGTTPTFPDSLDDLGDFAIKSVTVKSGLGPDFDYSQSVIAARTLGKISMANVNVNVGTHLLFADKLGSFSVKPVNAALPALKNLDAADNDATPEGDGFVIRIV